MWKILNMVGNTLSRVKPSDNIKSSLKDRRHRHRKPHSISNPAEPAVRALLDVAFTPDENLLIQAEQEKHWSTIGPAGPFVHSDCRERRGLQIKPQHTSTVPAPAVTPGSAFAGRYYTEEVFLSIQAEQEKHWATTGPVGPFQPS